jgi:AraC family transcriptional regulator, regulatory protein of adaptative response / methylated-DNA-[protein]-cysteine methyltransferase
MAIDDYHRVERAIRFLDGCLPDQPTLADVAREMGLSPSQCQRVFKRWAGVSPKRFLQFLTAESAKNLLESAESLLSITYKSGLTSPSRLHDLIVRVHGMTPGEYRAGGATLQIRYGFAPSPFGTCLIASTHRGVCNLAFVSTGEREAALGELGRQWFGARLVESETEAHQLSGQIFGTLVSEGSRTPVNLHVQGTNFQLRVWEALLRIPEGRVTSYGQVARVAGMPGAARAVGRAVGQNPIAFLIPCHRVIRSTGAFGDYRWGSLRKQAMLLRENGTRIEPDNVTVDGPQKCMNSGSSR